MGGREKVEVVARPLGHPTSVIHRRDPATAPRGGFWLLGFPPGPVRPSLDDLETTALRHGPHIGAALSMDARSTCTSAGRDSQRRRLPPPGLQAAGLQAHATTPSRLFFLPLFPPTTTCILIRCSVPTTLPPTWHRLTPLASPSRLSNSILSYFALSAHTFFTPVI